MGSGNCFQREFSLAGAWVLFNSFSRGGGFCAQEKNGTAGGWRAAGVYVLILMWPAMFCVVLFSKKIHKG